MIAVVLLLWRWKKKSKRTRLRNLVQPFDRTHGVTGVAGLVTALLTNRSHTRRDLDERRHLPPTNTLDNQGSTRDRSERLATCEGANSAPEKLENNNATIYSSNFSSVDLESTNAQGDGIHVGTGGGRRELLEAIDAGPVQEGGGRRSIVEIRPPAYESVFQTQAL